MNVLSSIYASLTERMKIFEFIFVIFLDLFILLLLLLGLLLLSLLSLLLLLLFLLLLLLLLLLSSSSMLSLSALFLMEQGCGRAWRSGKSPTTLRPKEMAAVIELMRMMIIHLYIYVHLLFIHLFTYVII